MADEKELLRLLKNADLEAFEQLYFLYSPTLLAKLDHLIPNEIDANDLLHDIFIRVWESRKNIDVEKPFAGYLYRIGQRLIIDYYRARARHHAFLKQSELETTETYNNSIVDNSEQATQILHRALSKLSNKQRRVFQLCKIEGKSYKEAAKILNIKPETVHTHLRLANVNLKKHINALDENIPGFVAVLLIWEKFIS